MTPFIRFVRKCVHKAFGRYYEGPNPPSRIEEMVELFVEAHPNATKQEWMSFAKQHACECYRTGWVRGFEWSERDLDQRPSHDPDVMADALAQGWRESEPIDWQGES